MTKHTAALASAYVGTIFAATWAVDTYGPIPVGLGLMAPAGVLFAGLAFTIRDLLHERAGAGWTMVAIVAGAALSALISGPLALAAGTAFLVSEIVDLGFYDRIRGRSKIAAVLVSNVAGLFVDSVIFLGVAFGSFAFLPGQIVGKLWMTLAAVAVLAIIRARRVLVA